jgi:hypothetical protein
MRRRALLSTIGVVATASSAGCLSVGGDCSSGRAITFERVDGAAIADREAYTLGSDDTPPVLGDLIERIRTAEGTEIETTVGDPLSWLTHLRTDNGYYELLSSVTADGEVSGPRLRLRRNSEIPTEPPESETLVYDDLPLQDRLRLGEMVDYSPERFVTRERDRGFESRPVVLAYLDSEIAAASQIADGIDASYLRVADGYFEIETVDDGTASATRYGYETERVATDVEGFADVILGEQGVTLSSPPPAVASLLETVREEEDGYLEICDEDSEADPNREAADELEAYLAELDTEGDGDIEYAKYDGEWHRIRVSEWVV